MEGSGKGNKKWKEKIGNKGTYLNARRRKKDKLTDTVTRLRIKIMKYLISKFKKRKVKQLLVQPLKYIEKGKTIIK